MRLKIKYEKEMQNYNSVTHSWNEIYNIGIVRILDELSNELNSKGFKFVCDVKPDKYFDRTGIIKIKTNLSKSAALMVLQNRLGGKLEFKW